MVELMQGWRSFFILPDSKRATVNTTIKTSMLSLLAEPKIDESRTKTENGAVNFKDPLRSEVFCIYEMHRILIVCFSLIRH